MALPSTPDAKRLPDDRDLIMDMIELTSQGGCCTLCRYSKRKKLFFEELTIDT